MKCERCGHELDDTDLFCSKCGKVVFEEYMDLDEEEESREQIIEEIPQEPERKREPRKRKPEKKSPVWLIAGCVLLVCLLVGILWGMLTVKQMDEEKKSYYGETQPVEDLEEETASTEKEETEKGETEEEKPEETVKEETKEETKEEEAKQESFVFTDKDSVDFSQYKKISVALAEQSSMAYSENYDYSANSAADGDSSTSWQEGLDGLGEGAGIKLSFDKPHKIRYMVLYLGNWRSDSMWEKNARPACLTINLGDKQSKNVDFSDEKKAFCLSFEEPVEASFVSLYIHKAYGGSQWNDNCISEVEFYEE